MRLAFGFRARVGKDTAAQYLIQKCGGISLSFASPLYDIMYYAQCTCGFDLDKDRQFLQYVGTDWARFQNPDVWVNILIKKVRSTPENTNIFVTDIRFPNEILALKKEGFTCICITRNTGRNDSHPSENSFDGYEMFDRVIENNGSLEDFQKNLEKFL